MTRPSVGAPAPRRSPAPPAQQGGGAGRRRPRTSRAARIGVGASVAVLASLLLPVAPAHASLADVGPVAANNYPAYFEDANGLRLRLCDDPAQGCAMPELPNPGAPVSWPDNYAGENFYFAAATADASYEAALESAYTTENATPGEEIIFSRIRIRLTGLEPGATYHITHPYGELDLEATPSTDKTPGEINYTDDQGCVAPPCGDFRSVLAGFVGDSSATSMTFLTRQGFNPAGAAAGTPIGDPLTPHLVQGSPFGTNFFRIEGPNAGGPGVNVVTQDAFTIEGQTYGTVDPNRPSTPDLAAASDSGRSSTDNITNLATPSFTGTAPAGSQVDLLVNGAVAGTAAATAEGTYSVSPSAALAAGTPSVKVRVPNPAYLATRDPSNPAYIPESDPANPLYDPVLYPDAQPYDVTTPATLESGILNVRIDTAAPAATILTPRPTNGTIDPTPTFAFSSSEDFSSFECSLTPSTEAVERAPESCVSPLTYDDQARGEYTFRVRATDVAGNVSAAASHTWTIGTAVRVPAAPEIDFVNPGSSSAEVNWFAPLDDGGSPITGYRVRVWQVSTNTVLRTIATGVVNSLAVTNLTNGTGYQFDVRAVNAVGGSAFSARSETVVPQSPVTAPDAPAIGTASAGNATATATWSAPANDGGSPVTSYTLQVLSGGNVVRTVSGIAATAVSSTVTGLTNGTGYSFRVQAVNAVGTSPLSAASNTVTPATAPGAPTIGTASPADASAVVRWTAPAGDGGSPVTEYRIQVISGGLVVRTVSGVPATATSATVTGLTNGTAYTFRVRAVNAVGVGALSAASNSVTPTATAVNTVPGRPAIGTAASGVAGGTVTATANWSPPASDGGTAITGYQVRAQRVSATGTVLGTTVSTVQPAAARTLQMTLPVGGASYRFAVRAQNAVGWSVYSVNSNVVIGR